jgi:hypothetical protein
MHLEVHASGNACVLLSPCVHRTGNMNNHLTINRLRLIMGVCSTGALGCCVVVHKVHRSSHQFYLTYMV